MSKYMYLNDIFLVIRVSLNVCREGNCLLKCFKLINGRYLYVGNRTVTVSLHLGVQVEEIYQTIILYRVNSAVLRV